MSYYTELHNDLLFKVNLSSVGTIRTELPGVVIFVRGPWEADGYPKEVRVDWREKGLAVGRVYWWSHLPEHKRLLMVEREWKIIKPKSPLICMAEVAE